MGSHRSKLILFAVVAVLAVVMTACEPPENALTQLKSVVACIAGGGYAGQCRTGDWLQGGASASTPDGKFVYVADASDSVLAVFMRTSKGDLVQKGCVSPSQSACAPARAMSNPVAVVATSKTVFVAARDSNAVAIFKRNRKTGALSQASGATGCISEDGTDGGSGQCFDGHALVQPAGLAVLGSTIAVASQGSNGVALFARTGKTGTISQGAVALGCITNDGTAGACAMGRALGTPTAVALTADNVFVTSTAANGVAVINRTTAGLTQDAAPNGCITEDGSDGVTSSSCTDGRELTGPKAVLANGNHIYVAASGSFAVSHIVYNPSDGSLTQGALGAGCLSEDGSSGACDDGHGLSGPVTLALQGPTLFVGSPDTQTGPPSFSGSEGSVAAIALDPTTGDLSQDTGTPGCIGDDGEDSCSNGNGFGNVVGLTTNGAGAIFALSSAFFLSPFGGVPDGVLAAPLYDPLNGWTQGTEGNAGCVSSTGRSDANDASTAGKCTKARALNGASGLAASSDNKNVYVASGASNAVDVFTRKSTGVLKQLGGAKGCISETSASGCADGRALKGVTDVAVTADGKNVYAVSQTSQAVVAFKRTSTGSLKQLKGAHGCISEPVVEGCTLGRGLGAPVGIAISPDDNDVYVVSAAPSNAIAVFQRDAATGNLTQAPTTDGCVSEAGDDGCADGKALQQASDIAISADGASVYVASRSSQAVAAFGRNTGTGVLTQYADPNGCISQTGRSDPGNPGTNGQCTTGSHLGQPAYLATRDDTEVYVRGDSDVIDALSRDTGTGFLSQGSGTNTCVSEDGSGGTCGDGQGITGFGSVVVAPNGNGVYVASPDTSSVAALIASSGSIATSGLGVPTQCYTSGTESGCDTVKALEMAFGVLVSPDNDWVYVTSPVNNSIAVFGRSP
jgi:DNA-binding beta-propeller fold protein YncE